MYIGSQDLCHIGHVQSSIIPPRNSTAFFATVASRSFSSIRCHISFVIVFSLILDVTK